MGNYNSFKYCFKQTYIKVYQWREKYCLKEKH